MPENAGEWNGKRLEETVALRGSSRCLDSKQDWFRIGFYTYRHSFASSLAALYVDQRIIRRFHWTPNSTDT